MWLRNESRRSTDLAPQCWIEVDHICNRCILSSKAFSGELLVNLMFQDSRWKWGRKSRTYVCTYERRE
jgi:hypothetical protein